VSLVQQQSAGGRPHLLVTIDLPGDETAEARRIL
jgi:hypothetical protein